MTDIASLIPTPSPVPATADTGTGASPEEFADALASASSDLGADDATAETADTEAAAAESPSVEQLLLGLDPSVDSDAGPATTAGALTAPTPNASLRTEAGVVDEASTVGDGTDAAAVDPQLLTADVAPTPADTTPSGPPANAQDASSTAGPIVARQATVTGPSAAPATDTALTEAVPTDDATVGAVLPTEADTEIQGTNTPPVSAPTEPALEGLELDGDAGEATDISTSAGPADPSTAERGIDPAATPSDGDAPSMAPVTAESPLVPTTTAGTPAATGPDPAAAVTATPAATVAAPTTPAAGAEATTAPAAPAAPAPFDPAEASPATQVAEALRDVRRLSDGTHRLSLQLHPEDLGAVQLEIALREGRLHLRAVAQTEAGRSALQSSIPELRSELLDAGVDAGSLEVGGETADGSTHAETSRDGTADTRPAAATAGPATSRNNLTTPTPNPMSTSTLVDIRL